MIILYYFKLIYKTLNLGTIFFSNTRLFPSVFKIGNSKSKTKYVLTKYMSFFMKYEKLLEKYYKIWKKCQQHYQK